jgi:hypothetical protein
MMRSTFARVRTFEPSTENTLRYRAEYEACSERHHGVERQQSIDELKLEFALGRGQKIPVLDDQNNFLYWMTT